MGAIFVDPRTQPLDRQASIATNNSSSTHASVSTDACADNADLASADPTLPSAQAACARTNGAMSDGDAVPGCERDAPGSSCTPNGGPPGARAANAGSDVACENRRVKGHTIRYLIVLPRGKRK
jgi:hypothetical protein